MAANKVDIMITSLLQRPAAIEIEAMLIIIIGSHNVHVCMAAWVEYQSRLKLRDHQVVMTNCTWNVMLKQYDSIDRSQD